MALQAYPYYTFLQAALDSAPRRANYTPTYTSALCQFALALVFLLQLDCLKFFVGLSIDRTTMEPIQKFFILTITMQLELGELMQHIFYYYVATWKRNGAGEGQSGSA